LFIKSKNVLCYYFQCPWSNVDIEGVSSLDESVTSSSNESKKEEEEDGILS